MNKIVDYNSYYQNLYNARATDEYIATKDNLNIKYDKKSYQIEELKTPLEPEDLNEWLLSVNLESRLKFYRDVNTMYRDDTLIAELMLEHLKKDGLIYESDFMIKKLN